MISNFRKKPQELTLTSRIRPIPEGAGCFRTAQGALGLCRAVVVRLTVCLGSILLTCSPAHAAEANVRGPQWLRDGIVASSDMEALTFVLRRGGGPQDATEQWHHYRSEAAVKKLQAAGVNFAIINFYNGAGIRAESED